MVELVHGLHPRSPKVVKRMHGLHQESPRVVELEVGHVSVVTIGIPEW